MKYGRTQSEARIEVRCEPAAQGGVSVAVRDHGPGVPDAQLATLFEPFFRGEHELTRQGTGLGLALVRDLTELMKGEVRASDRKPGLELQIRLRTA